MSNNVQIPMEDRVRSLERSEALVLYGRCHGSTHGQIAAKYKKTSDTWSRNLMTSVFEKLGAKKSDSRNQKNEYLKKQNVCEILDEVLQGKEANLENWPLYGWVALREGDNIQYREREEHERRSTDTEDSTLQPEETVLAFEDEDEADELSPPGRDEVEDAEEEKEKPRKGAAPIPLPIDHSTELPGAKSQRPFRWSPPRNHPRTRLLLFTSALICIACLGLAWLVGGRLLARFTATLVSTPTFALAKAPTNTPQISIPTGTMSGSSTPSDTLTPEASTTSGVSPTAVPMPIIENFNKPWSDVWQATGDPILTIAKFGPPFDGVLTTVPGHSATMAVGNIAWADYIIHIRGYIGSGQFFFGFRVKDLNNMLGIDCDGFFCNWVAIRNGAKEVLSKVEDIDFVPEFTINVDGENFNGSTKASYSRPALLILPPKYQGQFLNGGVYFRFRDVEIDYIEILPVR